MKSSRTKSLGFVVLAVLVASTSAFAVDIPLTNWTVPAYHSTGSSGGGITTMGDTTLGNAFIGVDPCRIVDTRAVSAFPAGYGPPSLAAGAPRNFDLNSNTVKCPGIPASVQAYSLNITVTNTLGPGFILIYPQGGTQPTVSTLNYVAGQTVANAAIVPSGTGGGVTVIAGVSGTDVIIDINGYFSLNYNDGVAFEAVGNVGSFFLPGFLIVGSNANTGNAAYGVWGLNQGGGTTMTNVSGAVTGWANSATGITAGVYGIHASATSGASGVLGVDSSGFGGTHYDHAGVMGLASSGQGVVGRVNNSAGEAVAGVFTDVGGTTLSQGFLGFSSTTAVEAAGNIVKTGTVSFAEPHPSDASKKLVYVALEGNEAGTYFRGRGKFQNGQAVINVPEDFRMVTLPDGLSIQVTPIGQMATVAVANIGLDRIVVNGSRNVEFFYTVNGVRRGYAGFRPIVENDKEFQPESPNDRMPGAFNEEIRSRLIANGTYKPDGTVNMETAQRLGWDRVWAAKQVLPPRPQLQDSP